MVDTRLAVLSNVTALNRQRKAAIQEGNASQVKEIQESINTLHDKLDDLAFISLETLEDSPAVKQTITQLRGAADDLEDEADNIKSVADALQKAAEIIDQTVNIITKLRELVPI
jgi:uncharacterized coiled-coil DUF342 family protein